MDLDELRAEAEKGLNRSLFVEHPDGYTCRCGAQNTFPCVCPDHWPRLVIAEIALSCREMRNKRDELSDELAAVRKLFASGPDTSCRTTWRGEPGGVVECVEVPLDDLREALGVDDD